MRKVLLLVGLGVTVGFSGIAGDGSVAWPTAADGSVPWPIGGPGDGQVFPAQLDVVVCSIQCAWGGCDIPGTVLECTCSGGRVCCLYYRCLQNPWWMFWDPCYSGTKVECYGISSEPGQPIPMQMPEAGPLYPLH